jgi:hypothetical protein
LKLYLRQKNWHEVARHRSDWRKKTGEAMAGKQMKEPQEKKNLSQHQYFYLIHTYLNLVPEVGYFT